MAFGVGVAGGRCAVESESVEEVGVGDHGAS